MRVLAHSGEPHGHKEKPMGALTDVQVKNLKPRAKAYQVADGEGLVLEVRPSGQKAWLYRYRFFGRAEKLSLGSYPDISLGKAREGKIAAQKLLAEKKSPVHAKQEEKRRYSDDLSTVSGLAEAYMTHHVNTLASASQGRAYIEKKILPAIGRRFIDEITPADCVGIVEKLTHAGFPGAARQVLGQLRGLFGYAVDRHLLTMNPAAQVRGNKIIGPKPSRERVLSSEEIEQYFKAVDAFTTSQANRIAFRLILLTLCRKGELVKARREHVNFERGEWYLPAENTKNGEEHVVALSRQSRALFERLVGLAGASPWLLPGRDESRSITITTLNQALYAAKRKSPDCAWLGTVWIHDLRRTASTHLHEMGFPSDVIEKALNHTIGGVRGVYNRATYRDQRKEMLQAWADMVDAWTSGSGGKVVPLGVARSA